MGPVPNDEHAENLRILFGQPAEPVPGDAHCQERDFWLSHRRQALEESLLKFLLGRIDPQPAAWARFRGRARELAGPAAIPSLDLWHQVYPEFPVRLGVARLAAGQLPGLADLFGRPSKTALHRAWEDLAAEYPMARALGMVFPWRGLARFVVLHNQPLQHETAGRFFTYSLPQGTRLRYFVLEPLVQLLAAHGFGQV